ncbi:SDR family NAD(P)-dependent oxidoreductase, partial [Streptomyces sp. NPDC059374]|uniref:SDR family NAD(P)-dependent oxidoreductase n=1 Tax=Streptomyces sp. NPDC059374 TaxID=3346814 RepID=UPI0036C84D05
MSTELQGRTAVVTGASKGIGLAVVEALAQAGARVVAGSRTASERLESLVEEGSVTWVPVDLAEPRAAEELVAAAGGGIDVRVNNVGTAPPPPRGVQLGTRQAWGR